MDYLLYVFIGLSAGLFSGIFGLGGGVVIVPALVYLAKFSQHTAQGTSVAMLLPPIGALAFYKYWGAGHVQIVPALILSASFFFFAWIGSSIALSIPELMMKRIFGGMLIAIGIFMLSGK
ncbi:MAG: permease [Deltaproteobacteria bacterium CG11_big_fil_rev_8_21_14_0_20_42_23]|nr:MAG: permease [Deltaproteobacteria bacterium CG11_big_fil_rev_8_21_14_0_20_42_23]PJC63543.1 MAG: permease [Deltaproteobacteria bacterium CG_4_9_14_0_2_um_filter_42_21]